MACMICHGAMPEGEVCRACGHGEQERIDPDTVPPMSNLQVAIRQAGGWLSTDGERERIAFRKAVGGEGDE